MSANDLYYEDIELGDEIGPVGRVVSDEDVIEFVGVSHVERGESRFTSAKVAASEGLPNPVVPGAMNIAIMSQLITGWSPNVTLRKLDCVFRGLVPHNHQLTLKGLVTDKDIVDGTPQLECDVVMENEEGTPLVIGKATVLVPMRESGS